MCCLQEKEKKKKQNEKKKSCYPHKFTEYKHRIWFIPNNFPLNHSEHNVDL